MRKQSIDFHDLFNYKRIYDSVHGTIGLSETEVNIIDCRAFQRLRNIKQLGLAHLAFPEADYSRFSHSIGVCHITGLFLENLYKNGFKLDKREIKRYRLAGLLHDIGHYPFSHTMEHAVAEYNRSAKKSSMVRVKNTCNTNARTTIDFMGHEEVGKEILINDKEIKGVLATGGFKPKDIYPIFTGADTNPISSLISSDIDADRIDYLLRTSYATKLPYGSVDLPYILSQIRLDKENRVCFTEKALRPLDHFLLSRYFDYQRVTYNKTTVALDKVLQDLIIQLIDDNEINLSRGHVLSKISNSNGEWYEFDDSHVLTLIKEIRDNSPNQTLQTQVQSVLERKPPTLLINIEFLDDRYEDHPDRIYKSREILESKKEKWSSDHNIDPNMWDFWEPEKHIVLTSTGSLLKQYEEKNIPKNVFILDPIKNSSEPIFMKVNSLMNSLADKRLYCLRLYAFLGDKTDDEKKEIREALNEEYLEEFNKLK